jgi:antitoxin (DNA-binding transcriptional repressor) of toxin-antitoxin stability system
MTTITAVDLRNNLGDYIARAANGEQIVVTYRRGISAMLQAIKGAESIDKTDTFLGTVEALNKKYASTRGSLEGVDAKEEMHKHWIEKYGTR